MSENKVIIAVIDEWQALYFKGESKYQNHSLPMEILLKYAVKADDYEIKSYKIGSVMDKKIIDLGGFPKSLKRLKEIEKTKDKEER